MRRNFSIAVFVTAVLVGQLSVNSQDYTPELTSQIQPVPDTLPNSDVIHSPGSPMVLAPPVEEGFNGFALFRAVPDLGAPGSPGNGFKHFMLPMDKYTTWYRPRAATLTAWQRCAPDSFRPRGFGHLFARPCDGFRMEYTPYMLKEGTSQYGPSYIARQPDPRCEHCDQTSGECKVCR